MKNEKAGLEMVPPFFLHIVVEAFGLQEDLNTLFLGTLHGG
jgi:hypothetical protein